MNRIYVGTCVGQTLSATMTELFVVKKTCRVVTDMTTDVGNYLIFNGEFHKMKHIV